MRVWELLGEHASERASVRVCMYSCQQAPHGVIVGELMEAAGDVQLVKVDRWVFLCFGGGCWGIWFVRVNCTI